MTSETEAYRAVLLAAKDALDWASDPVPVMCSAEALRAKRPDHPLLPLLESKYARLMLNRRPPARAGASQPGSKSRSGKLGLLIKGLARGAVA